MIDLRAEQGIQRVGVGIEVDTAHRTLGREGPQNRQSDRAVAPGRDRHDARGMQCGEKRLNLLDAIQEVEQVVYPHVTEKFTFPPLAW
jgi:hypothetical protein